MCKAIDERQLEELAKFVRDEVIPHRLYEVRGTVLKALEILGIEITLR